MSCECECDGDRCGGGSNVLLSFLLGGAIGGILGVLYAPGPGEETRRKIKFYADEAADKAVEKMQKVRVEAEEALSRVKTEVNAQKDRITSAFDAGRSAFKEEKDQLDGEQG